MNLRKISIALLPVALLVLGMTVVGCSPRPPISYQTLQVQDSEEAEGYDVYMYISVKRGLAEGDVTDLLEWFRDVKFKDVNKIKIFVWDNPQSALINAMGDMIATLEVDRENGIDEIKPYYSSR